MTTGHDASGGEVAHGANSHLHPERSVDVSELLSLEARFRAVADFTYDWELWLGPAGELRYVSPSSERITGYPPNAFIQHPGLLFDIVHPEDRAAVETHLDCERRDPDPCAFDYRILTSQGDERWIGHVCQPVYGDDGTWLGRRISNRDITEVRLTERALRESEERYRNRSTELHALHEISLRLNGPMALDELLRAILDQSTALLRAEMAVLFLYDEADQSLVARLATEKMRHMTGLRLLPGQGATGRAFVERRALIIEDYAAWDGRLRQYTEAAHLTTFLAVPLMKAEEVIGVLSIADVRLRPFTEHDVWLAELFAAQATVALENARLREAEQDRFRQVQETRARMSHVEKIATLGTLAAALAHEINNPLQAIQSHLELVMDFPLPPDKQTEFLGVVRHEVGRLTGIVRRVLDYARPGGIARREVNVADLVSQTLALAHKQMEREGVEVVVEIVDGMVVHAGSDRLMQVLLNLVLNAIEAMGHEGRVTISGRSEGGDVVITVVDEGPGIAPEVLAHLFEPFFTTKPAGTGLGLAVSRNLIDQHGGTLTAANRPDGRGAVFTIRLPESASAGEEER